MRFSVIAPIWKRFDVFKIFAAGMRRVEQQLATHGHSLDVVVAGSEGAASRTLAESFGYDYIETQNNQLKSKFNATMLRAYAHNPDYVCVLGSDDLINVEYFISAIGFDFSGILGCYFLDLPTQRTIFWHGYDGIREGEPVGAGCMFSKALLDAMQWQPWTMDGSIWPDRNVWERVRAIAESSNLQRCGELAILCDLKSDENLTPFDDLLLDISSAPRSIGEVLRMVSKEEWDLITAYERNP